MMKVVMEDVKVMKKSIDAISALIDEAEFKVSPENITLKATDPSQISMVDFELKKDVFKEYNVDKETAIGIDLESFSNILKRAQSGEELTLELDEKNTRLKIVLKGYSVKSFFIPLIDINTMPIPSPKIEFDSNIKLKAEVLHDALKNAALLSSHIIFGTDQSNFYAYANSSKGELKIETEKDSDKIVDFNVSADSRAMFPLDYLADMLKTASSDTVVEVKLKNDAPIMLKYDIHGASIEYFLAPRIESR